MIVINDVQVLLTPIELQDLLESEANLAYVSDGMDSIVWGGRSKEYYLSCFSFEKLKEVYDSYQ